VGGGDCITLRPLEKRPNSPIAHGPLLVSAGIFRENARFCVPPRANE
jgi:hypothetical protein